MARTESIASAGYFPTPSHLIPWIASVLHPMETIEKSAWDRPTFSVLDPCAGDGNAILSLLREIHSPTYHRADRSLELYTCEMEERRFEGLKTSLQKENWNLAKNCLHGDAFRISFDRTTSYSSYGVSLLYLNPPYDTDRVHGRLEQKFLDRFTSTLMVGGLLIFVVPGHALKASAEFIGRNYSDVRCFRFPDADYQAFKQVVLYAHREDTRIDSDTAIVSQVLTWASDASSIPEFPSEPLYFLPNRGNSLGEWKLRSLDVQALKRKVRPWTASSKSGASFSVSGILPDVPIQDLLLRTYPVATPPRPAHIAAGIASGIFNGQAIRPNDKSRDLPELLIKGVFSKEYRTVEEKLRSDGSVKAVVQVQQPKLIITVLNLETSSYHELASGTEATGNADVEDMNVADLLVHYSDSLMGVMERQCPVLYDPRRDADSIQLPTLPRSLFVAQGHATRALIKLLGGPNVPMAKRRHRSAFLLGEIGSGKTSVALAVTQAVRAQRILVMCPPHLLDSWKNEISAVVPHASVRILSTVEDLEFAKEIPTTPGRPLIAIMSREAGKLAHAWANVEGACPKCGGPTPEGVDFAKKRARCERKPLILGDTLFREAHRLAIHLQPFDPQHNTITSLLRGRFDRVRGELCTGLENPRKFPGLDASFINTAIGIALERMCESHDENWYKAFRALVLASWSPERVVQLARLCLGSEHLKSFGKTLALLLPPGHPEQDALQEEFPDKGYYTGGGYYGGWPEIQNHIRTLSEGKDIRYPLEISWSDGVLKLDGMQAGGLRAANFALQMMASLGKHHWGPACGEHLFGAIPEPRRVSLAKHITRYYKKLFDFLILDECFVAGTLVSGRPIESIQVGELIDSYDEVTGSLVRRMVTRLWKKVPNDLVRVHFSDGRTLICTPNHPIWVEPGAWVPAGALFGGELVRGLAYGPCVDRGMSMVCETSSSGRETSTGRKEEGVRFLRSSMFRSSFSQTAEKANDMAWDLSLVQKPCLSSRTFRNRPTPEGLRVLWFGMCATGQERRHWEGEQDCNQTERTHIFGSYANQQSDEGPSLRPEDGGEAKREDFFGSWGEWDTHKTSNFTVCPIRLANGIRHQYTTGVGTIPITSQLLQGGHRKPGVENCDRGGWIVTQTSEMEIFRQTKRIRTKELRVDRVEVLERGSDDTYGGMCRDGYVYNLEVEGTHTYFAEGVLVHNCHEYSTDGSAQERSAHRLTKLGVPTIFMTGTVMNGYAESLFANMWAASPRFRTEFAHNEIQRYLDRYGYRKRLLEDKDEAGDVVEFGSQSDRVTRTEKYIGNAPGILPLFLLDHLLPVSVTLHKSDLAIDLPKCVQTCHKVEPSRELKERYERLKDKLVDQIRTDMFDKDYSGKLFGQLSELPSYLDRATMDVGNTDHGDYAICYPPSLQSKEIVSQPGFSPLEILPKERWMLDLVEKELEEGRNVMVFSWHVALLPRLAKILSEHIGDKVPILHANKVATGKRQEWISREIVKKHRRVMVTNPVAIQTGLNNLVHFSSEIWMENPACNPTTFRQAIGRVDRIGQKNETRIFTAVYDGTLQVQLYDLLMKKVAVSISTDGLDPESALQAAGLGEPDYLAGLSIGKQIWNLLGGLNVDQAAE